MGGLKFVYFPVGSVLEVVQAGPPNPERAGPWLMALVSYQGPVRLRASRSLITPSSGPASICSQEA